MVIFLHFRLNRHRQLLLQNVGVRFYTCSYFNSDDNGPLQPSTPTISFQELYRSQPLRKSPFNENDLNLNLRQKKLRDAMPELASVDARSEFVTTYSHEEMGRKLRNLRPEDKKTKFSLAELNERLRLLQEMNDSDDSIYGRIRQSLIIMHESSKKKKHEKEKAPVSSFNILDNINFKLYPPKETLVEKYFHPDHMSFAEKHKLELNNVREKFKISESDCGSARVQVAQLTTKIKHLATALHKMDKHSRKGLQAMVQNRKKLLKYLRRTDWDSYCFCLSELGLRDSADYKA